MLGRKIFSAFIVSIIIILILATIEITNHGAAGFGEYVFGYSIFVVPVVFVYGILTSIFSDSIGNKFKRHPNLGSLTLHFLFGLVFSVPFNLANSFMWNDLVSIALFGFFGIVFFFVDLIVKNFWNMHDQKHLAMIDEK